MWPYIDCRVWCYADCDPFQSVAFHINLCHCACLTCCKLVSLSISYICEHVQWFNKYRMYPNAECIHMRIVTNDKFDQMQRKIKYRLLPSAVVYLMNSLIKCRVWPHAYPAYCCNFKSATIVQRGNLVHICCLWYSTIHCSFRVPWHL